MQARGYEIDFDDWHADVHGTLPYKELLPRDPALRRMLQSIPLPKHIFTNADTRHADICLERMGIADCFQAGLLALSACSLCSWDGVADLAKSRASSS